MFQTNFNFKRTSILIKSYSTEFQEDPNLVDANAPPRASGPPNGCRERSPPPFLDATPEPEAAPEIIVEPATPENIVEPEAAPENILEPEVTPEILAEPEIAPEIIPEPEVEPEIVEEPPPNSPGPMPTVSPCYCF